MNFIEDVLERFPAARPALVTISDDGERRQWGFGELIARSAGLSGAFAARGVRRGDVVMTLIGNRIEWVLTMLACWRMGAIALPCNTQLRRHDLELRVSAANPALCVGTDDLLGELPSGVPAMTTGEIAAVMDEERPQEPPADVADLDPADGALIVFTSGTTGEPRGALHPQAYLPAQRIQAEHWLGARDGDLVWCTTATGWSKSARNVFVAPWLCGAAALLHDGRFDPVERLELIEREGVSVLCQAPTEYRMLAERAEIRPLPSLRRIVSAGEALNPEVIEAFRNGLGLDICDGYGQTETGHVSGNLVGDEVRDGSMGRPLPGFEVRIDGGELQVKRESCPTFFSRYLDGRPVRGRVVADRGRRPPGRGRLPLVRGTARRPDRLLGLSDRAVRGRVGAAHPSHRRRGGRGCGPGRRAGLCGAGDRRPSRGGARRCSRPRAPGALQAGRRPVQVPAHRRVRGRASEDGQRKDQAGRAAARPGPAESRCADPLTPPSPASSSSRCCR